MPRLSTPPSSNGSGEEVSDGGSVGYDTSYIMRNKFLDANYGTRMMGEPGHWLEEDGLAPASVTSDLLDGDSRDSDGVDEIPNGPQKEPAAAPAPKDEVVKRKRGQPRKDATNPVSSKKGPKSTANGQRRSSRVVEQAKVKVEKVAAQNAGGVRKKVSSVITLPQRWVPGSCSTPDSSTERQGKSECKQGGQGYSQQGVGSREHFWQSHRRRDLRDALSRQMEGLLLQGQHVGADGELGKLPGSYQ